MKMQGTAGQLKNFVTSIRDNINQLGDAPNGYDVAYSITVPMRPEVSRLETEDTLLSIKLLLGALPADTTTSLVLEVSPNNERLLSFLQNVQLSFNKLEELSKNAKEAKSKIIVP